MSSNADLNKAFRDKKDEFYTQIEDIEKEMVHYRTFFRDKVVFCNCDDPYESNFFKYFALNFNFLGLKKLIATCYVSSPIVGEQLSLFDDVLFSASGTSEQRHPYKIEITEVTDANEDGRIDITDVEYLLRNRKNVLTQLAGDGDFRSDECIAMLQEADVVCTNPPFSLFRQYVAQLIQHDKKFIIIGNVNAITYKEIFPLIMNNEIWLGYSIHSGDREFRVPDDYPLNASGCRVSDDGKKYIRVKGVRWFTNIDYEERHEDLILYKVYSPESYPSYDNYDAIEVSQTADIPCDYYDVMGVPITFIDKFNPEQFEIIGMAKRGAGDPSLKSRVYTKNDYPNYSDLNATPVIITDGIPKNTYPRILIRRKV